MAAGSNADIELLAGLQGGGSIAGASGRRIQHELENIINRINKNPAGVKITLSKNGESLLKQDIAKAVESVKIESFNTTAAVAKLKTDIQAALAGVAIPVGVVAAGAASGAAAAAQTQTTTETVDAAEIEKYDNAVKSLNTRLSTLNRRIQAVKTSSAGVNEALSGISGLAGGSTSSGSPAKNTSSTMASLQQIISLNKKAESLLRNNPRIVGTGYGDTLNSVIEQLKSGSVNKDIFKQLKNDVLQVEVGLKNAGLQGKTLWSVLKSGYEKFGGWALITKSMMAAVNSVRQMIDNVTQLDAAMTELRKVTDETDATYEQFFSEATVRARSLGATVTDTINASADFARFGYNIEDAATLADTAIIYKNVGDGITDIGVASQSIISTLKGFNLEAEDATHVVDAFNEVGNNFAISSAGIGDALTRSAASLSAANNTMEESIALITAMNTTLQDPEKVGTTLKTITMYLRASKVELEEAGESTEGMAESTSKLRDSVLALTGQKVDIMLDDKTYKSTYQILKEISQVWSSMADIDQAALLELLGGKRNANATASLIQNFGIAEQALESATDSAGSAAAENEKYLDSILGKVAQFNAAFETLSATVIDADFSKGVVDAGTTILDVITQLIDGVGTLNTLAMGAGAALSLGKVNTIFSPFQVGVKANSNGGDFTSSFSIGLTSQLSRDKAGIDAYNAAVQTLKSELKGVEPESEAATKAQNDFKDATEAAKTSVSGSTKGLIDLHAAQEKGISATNSSSKSLITLRAKTIAATVATTALNMAISLGLSIAIQGLVTGIDYLIHREERMAEAAEEASDSVSKISTEAKELESSTKSAATTIQAFGDQIKYVNGKLTSDTLSTEQITQYSEAVKSLTEMYPSLISGYDAEGNAIVSLSGGYSNLTKNIDAAYKAKLLLMNAELDENMPDIVKDASYKTSSLTTQLKNSQALVEMAKCLSKDPYNKTDNLSVSERDLANWVYGKDSAELGVDLTKLDLSRSLNQLIAKEGGKWFEDNKYFGVKIATDSVNGWATGINQVFSSEDGGKKLDDSAIAEYLSHVISPEKLESEVSRLEEQIKAKWAATNQSLLSYFSTDENFVQVNDAFGGLLSNVISGADWNALIDGDVTWDSIKDYVQTNLVNVFNKIDLGSVQADIKSLLSGGADLTADQFTAVFDNVKNALLEATDGNQNQVKAIMSSIESAMSVTADDIAKLNKQVYEGVDGGVSALKILTEATENWTTTEKEAIAAGIEGITDESDVVKEFISEIENGNPTIAELQALIIKTSDGSLEAAGSFAEWKKQYEELVNDISGARSFNDIVESFGTIKEATDSAYESFLRLNGNVTQEEYESWEPDEYYNKSVEAFNKFKALYDEGLIGRREFAQYQKYFGLESLEETAQFFTEQGNYYIEGKEGLQNWINKIYEMNQSGLLSKDLASIEFLADGKSSFHFDVSRINELAAALNMTEEQAWNFVRAIRAYSESWESMSVEDLNNDFKDVGVIKKIGEEFVVSYEDIANYTGLSRTEIELLIDKLNELNEYDGKLRLDLGLVGELEAAGNELEKIDQVLKSFDISSFDINGEVFTVTQNMINDMLKQLSPENVKQYIAQWSKISGVVIPADLKIDDQKVSEAIAEATEEDGTATIEVKLSTATAEQAEELAKQLEDLGMMDIEIEIDDNTVTVVGNLKRVREAIIAVQKASSSMPTLHVSTSGNVKGGHSGAFATGTQDAPQGFALLGDEASPTGAPRPELVVSRGEAYLAGVNGPVVGHLNDGDRVYTYDQTKKILGGMNGKIRLPAFASGVANLGRNGSIGAGSLWSSVASSSNSSAGGNDFESLYKYHQHLLKMEQESQQDYLNWLNKAYKDAYARGEIELDDYYKYQEEIFDLIRELVQDNLDDAEHYIDMLGHYDGNEKQVIAIYQDLMKAIEKEISAARAAGLNDNDEYIQNLQKQWWSYRDEITDIQDEIADNAKDAVEDLIDLRVKMIKQDLKNEKDALKEKKSALKDFYDEQKQMLQDEYDEEEYLDEQSEKRKAVTDLEMQLSRLSNDDSAWAQKKRLQLESELSDARKELRDFEKQHALETAQDQIDKAYEIEEKGIDDSIDLIEDKEDNAKALRDQALEDLRSADKQMYEDMIEWNARYGSGIDQDITDAWTEATKAMSEYYKLNQRYYEDINFNQGVYPDFAPKDNGSWSTNPISGDNPANKSASKSQPSAASSKAGSVSNIGPQLQYGSRGSDVSALQTALKEMGLYSDKIDGHFGPNTKAGVMAFQRQEGISVDGIVGPNTKAKFKKHGYASGTSNALAGLHEIWEEGAEYIFTSSNGKKYRMFSGGEKVLNADATNFLYDFANNGSKVLETIVSKLMGGGLPNVSPSVYSPVVNMGDIVVQGGASERTVSEIRRAQREQVDFMLKEFRKLRP